MDRLDFVLNFQKIREAIQQEPPLEWYSHVLFEAPWGWAIVFIAGSIAAVCISSEQVIPGICLGIVIFLWIAITFSTPFKTMKALRAELTALLLCCVSALLVSLAGPMSYDAVYRHRAMGMCTLASKGWVAMMNFRMKTYACFLVWSVGTDFSVTMMAAARHGDHYPIRVFVMLIAIALVYLGFAYLKMLQNIRRYNIEKRLESEKNTVESLLRVLTTEKDAVESLLSMMCDATFWVSCSGELIVRSDPKFDAIMGRGMLGSSILGGLPLVEDMERVRSVLSSESADNQHNPVALLPVILSCSADAVDRRPAEFFIVDRRFAMASIAAVDSDAQLGFFFGVRLCPSGISTIGEANTAVPRQHSVVPKFSASQSDLAEIDPADSNAFINLYLQASEVPTEDHAFGSPRHGLRRRVSFSSGMSDTSESANSSSRTSGTKSILKKSSGTRRLMHASNSFCGPIHGPGFERSGTYLHECSLSTLQDLVSSWNFEVSGCCSWHGSLHRLKAAVNEMNTMYTCLEEWRPDAKWQCQSCTAVIGETLSGDTCWLCWEPRPVAG